MRSASVLGFALVLATFPAARARADDGDERRAETPGAAAIVVISPEGEHEGLAALLDELLGRQAIVSEVARASRFDPDALFVETPDDPRVHVFIVVEARSARLYFRGPGGQRFLLRKLALANGLDAVGKELIGHVVESATLALLRSTEGLSREQASVELSREAPDDDTAETKNGNVHSIPPRTPAKAPDRAATSGSPSRSDSRESSFEFAAGARYGAFWSGSAFGVAHGPGAELRIVFRSGGAWLVGVRGLGERHFAQTLSVTELEANVNATVIRGGVDVGVALGASHRLFAGVGAGADIVSVDPARSLESDIELGAAKTRAVPALRVELRYELLLGHVAVAAAGFVDALPLKTRYELAESGARRALAEPLVARPGAALSVTFSTSARTTP